MSKRDYYEVLGVSRNADASSIKSAYRKLAMKHHPDKNPGDKKSEALFKEATEAYEILKDDEKRAAYDQFGHSAFEGRGSSQGQGGFGGFSGNFSDIFDEFFGDVMGGGSQRNQSRGADLRYDLDVSLEEAFSGKNEKSLTRLVWRLWSCHSCIIMQMIFVSNQIHAFKAWFFKFVWCH